MSTTYQIQQGEWLKPLAEKYKGNFSLDVYKQKLKKANPNVDWNKIEKGDIVELPWSTSTKPTFTKKTTSKKSTNKVKKKAKNKSNKKKVVKKIKNCKNKCGECKSTWDSSTNKKIKLLHPKIRCNAYGLINKIEKDLKIKVRITTGYRTIAEQNRLYAQGRTTPGKKVTTVIGGRSIHNYGLAIDIVEIKNGKANWNTKWKEFALIGKACGFKWGGDWKKFKDKPHFQKTFGYSSLKLLRKAKRNEFDKDGYIIL